MLLLIGCASETAKMAHKIHHDKDYIFYKKSSFKCRNAINRTDEEDVIFKISYLFIQIREKQLLHFHYHPK